jgi:hypothetical protein
MWTGRGAFNCNSRTWAAIALILGASTVYASCDARLGTEEEGSPAARSTELIGVVHIPPGARDTSELATQVADLPAAQEAALLSLSDAEAILPFALLLPSGLDELSLLGVRIYRVVSADGEEVGIYAELEYSAPEGVVVIREVPHPPGSGAGEGVVMTEATPVAVRNGIAWVFDTDGGRGLYWEGETMSISIFGDLTLARLTEIAESIQ